VIFVNNEQRSLFESIILLKNDREIGGKKYVVNIGIIADRGKQLLFIIEIEQTE